MPDSPVLSYTSQDFESIFEDIVQFAQTTFPAELWTDFHASNVGTYLLRVKAYIGDLLGFQLNASVMETLLSKVVRERNMRVLAQTFNYHMRSATSASTTLRIYDLPTPPNAAYPFTISKRHQFTIDSVVYQPRVDKTVTALSVLNDVTDGYYAEIDVYQGEEIFEEPVANSNGLPAQTYKLTQYPVLDGTIDVNVLTDGAYTLVDSFTKSTGTDRHYRIFTDELGIVTLEFGNGINGKIPTLAQLIEATYRVGGGIEGNQQAGLLTWSASGSSDGATPLPSVVQAASIRNTTAATGGGPKETIEQARRTIPGWNRTNDRAITVQDYADLSALVPGVAHAKSMAGSPVLGSVPVYVFLVPAGGGTPSTGLKNDVGAYLAPRKTPGRTVYLDGARYVSIQISIDAYLKPTARRDIVTGYLNTSLSLTFDPDLLDFVQVYPIQNLYNAVSPENIPGLHHAFVRRFRVENGWDTYVSRPPTGSGVVQYLYANPQLAVTREWNIRFIPPTPPLTCPEFKVYERVLGVASAVYGNSVTDDGSYFPVGTFVGYTLVPRPEDGSNSTYVVVANTERTLTTNGSGLNMKLTVGDPFAVEKYVSNGKVISSTITLTSAGNSAMTVNSTANWQVGDEVYGVTANYGTFRRKVQQIASPTVLVFTEDISLAVEVGDTLHYVWKDPADRMEFSVTAGASPWAVGDEFFIDTSAEAQDLILRGSDFPVLDPGDVTLSIIGGVALCLLAT